MRFLLPFWTPFLACAVSCRSAPLAETGSGARERLAIDAVLDDWHSAASKADGERYFGHLSEDAVFLGTDATERWTKIEFRAYAEPYFARGTGWTYEPRERHVMLAPHGEFAWFDEKLWNEKYGECRGTGVMRKEGGRWRIAHYSLTLLVPNDVAGEVVEIIRRRETTP